MTTLNLQVSSGNDDAIQFTHVNATVLDQTIHALNDAGDVHGHIFRNVTIPPGSTINSAYFQVYCNNTASDTVAAKCGCEAADNAADFTTAVGDISNRTLASPVTFSVTDVTGGTVNNHYTLADIKDSLQAVVNRAGWSSGNKICVVLRDWTSGDLTYRPYDSASTRAAKLLIDYTEPAGAVKLRRLMQGARLGMEFGL